MYVFLVLDLTFAIVASIHVRSFIVIHNGEISISLLRYHWGK